MTILNKNRLPSKSTNTQHTISIASTCTCQQAIIQRFIDSGCTQSWINNNADIVESVRIKNLSTWIWGFTESWSDSPLKAALDRAIYFRNTASFITKAGVQNGLTIIVEPRDNKDLKLILSKYKQIRYKIKQIDKEAEYLLIRYKDAGLGENLQTGEKIESLVMEVV